MKKMFFLPIVFMTFTINVQTMYGLDIYGSKCQFSKLNDSDKKEAIINLGNIYCKTAETDTIIRRQIVDFVLDSIIGVDEKYSALASKILLQYSRINEYDSSCINKLLQLLNVGYYNIDFVQLVGCVGDERFIAPLYNKYISDVKKNEIDVEILKNTLARLGNKEVIQDRLCYYQSILSQKMNPLIQEYADAMKSINYINRKDFYDLLLCSILNDIDKVIIVGEYGGDPFGGDDNIYCTLASFLIELLSDGIIDFPVNQFVCSDDKKDATIDVVKKWIRENIDTYQIKKWHPLYGFNYLYW